eukprot:364585-Chlamydomonas_euryale.AAC.5
MHGSLTSIFFTPEQCLKVLHADRDGAPPHQHRAPLSRSKCNNAALPQRRGKPRRHVAQRGRGPTNAAAAAGAAALPHPSFGRLWQRQQLHHSQVQRLRVWQQRQQRTGPSARACTRCRAAVRSMCVG